MRFVSLIRFVSILGVIIGCRSPSPKLSSAVAFEPGARLALTPGDLDAEEAVANSLDAQHAGVARAGTGATERWRKTEFEAYCSPHFACATG